MLSELFKRLEKDAFDAAHDQQETGKNMREVLSEGILSMLGDLARAECVYCKRGDPPRRLPRGTYSHRVHAGKGGSLIGMPCRATEIRKYMVELEIEVRADAERKK